MRPPAARMRSASAGTLGVWSAESAVAVHGRRRFSSRDPPPSLHHPSPPSAAAGSGALPSTHLESPTHATKTLAERSMATIAVDPLM